MGKKMIEALISTLTVALKTIKGANIKSKILAMLSLSQSKNLVLKKPNRILKYKGNILPNKVKKTVIKCLKNFDKWYQKTV